MAENNNNNITNANIDNNNSDGERVNSQGQRVDENGVVICTINTDTNNEYEESDFQFFGVGDLVVDNNEKKEYVFNKYSHKKETPQNLRKWLLFDTASTTNLACNKKNS